jgi:hypothetical protein
MPNPVFSVNSSLNISINTLQDEATVFEFCVVMSLTPKIIKLNGLVNAMHI